MNLRDAHKKSVENWMVHRVSPTPVVTIIDGVSVHSDGPMSDEAKGWAADIIKAAREKMAGEVTELKADKLRLMRALSRFTNDA